MTKTKKPKIKEVKNRELIISIDSDGVMDFYSEDNFNTYEYERMINKLNRVNIASIAQSIVSQMMDPVEPEVKIKIEEPVTI